MTTTRFLSSITALAGMTLAASLLQAGSAQAAAFYDFNIEWNDSTTTAGWLKVNDTPDYEGSDPYYGYNYQGWSQNNLLDANFTHEGTSYNKSDITSLNLSHYDFPAGSYLQPYYGNVANFLNLGLSNQFFYASDVGADGSPSHNSDYGDKYTNGSYGGSAKSVSLVERSAKAVPEPTTMAGLALAGIAFATTRRKQQKAMVRV